jgi:hypothetical protein
MASQSHAPDALILEEVTNVVVGLVLLVAQLWVRVDLEEVNEEEEGLRVPTCLLRPKRSRLRASIALLINAMLNDSGYANCAKWQTSMKLRS